jgi:hypothetical protein
MNFINIPRRRKYHGGYTLGKNQMYKSQTGLSLTVSKKLSAVSLASFKMNYKKN